MMEKSEREESERKKEEGLYIHLFMFNVPAAGDCAVQALSPFYRPLKRYFFILCVCGVGVKVESLEARRLPGSWRVH